MQRYPLHLSRRERQIMDLIYRLGEVPAARVQQDLPDPPSYSAVRAMLRILVNKGLLRHRAEKGRYLYSPTRPHHSAARAAVQSMMDTFFAGSAERAVAALLDARQDQLSDEQLDRLARLIDQARKEGR
jgi:predicted transcriptional regulator